AIQADPAVTVAIHPPADAPVTAAKRPRKGNAPVASGSSRYVMTIGSKKDAPIGNTVANVTLTTTAPRAPTVAIRPFLIVAGRLQTLPMRLYVQPSILTQPQRINVSKPGGTGLAILGVESADPDFTASVNPVVEGREYNVTVTYKGKAERGPVNTNITVKTNEPGQESIVIPLAGRV